MTLDAYARLVTDEVRRRLPDVSAARSSTTVTWRRGTARATLDATDRATWWLRAGAVTYTERFDADSAHVTAENLIAHYPEMQKGPTHREGEPGLFCAVTRNGLD